MYVRGYLQGSENGRVVTIDSCQAEEPIAEELSTKEIVINFI